MKCLHFLMLTIRAKTLAPLLSLMLWGATAMAAPETSCVGKFPNPITDICWSCVMPITIAGTTVGNLGGQEDIPNPPTSVCSCVVNPAVGLTVGFWEPARVVEVVRKPFCLVSLGGINLDPGIAAPQGTRFSNDSGNTNVFYQAHYYINTVMAWLKVIDDFPCLEDGDIDLAYITEVDPLWNDDELTAVLHPEAILFANPIAVAACAADCVKATLGFGFSSLYWCAGCQGGLYPLDGHASTSMGGVRTAELMAQRLVAKMHRQQIAYGWHGQRGLCGPYYLPTMDKTAYKMQLLYPLPATEKFDGRCCQPFGRTTVLWGAGKEFPIKGEDFSFLLFRKRNCCVGY